MGSLFGSGGGGGGGSTTTYVSPPPPPAAGTITETIRSGNPHAIVGAPPAQPESEEDRRRRLEAQYNILGGGADFRNYSGSADGSGTGGTGPGEY